MTAINLSFEHPYFLLFLPLGLCLVYCKKTSRAIALPKLDWIPRQQRFYNLNTLLKITIFTLSTLALSAPFLYHDIAPSQKNGRAIVLAMDCSGSMRESGYSQEMPDKSKFELLQEVSKDFISQRISDNIGVVVFGTFAFCAAPVTYDHSSLQSLLSMQEVEIAGKNTAIGDALTESIKALSYAKAKEKIIILITDGISNAGSISIKDAVEEAKKEKIKIYSIALGDKKSIDTALLKKISHECGGSYYEALSLKDLITVYHDIDKLEPSEIRSEQYLEKKPLFYLLLFPAVLLFFLLLLREERLL